MALLNSGRRFITNCIRFQQPAFFSTTTKLYEHDYTHFGFESVRTNEKASKVHNVFSKVATKYDIMNDVMSGGIHRLWKDQLIRKLNPNSKSVLLDCAGGTGDIAFRFVKHINNKRLPEDSSHVTVCDINSDMLEVGKKRAQTEDHNISWVCGSAEDLPFPDASFTCYTIAFGIRNCTDIKKVIQEAYRVLSPGGRFMCLEFSQVTHPILKRIYDTYSFQVIPVMGEVIASDWKSYQYLVESIRKFPSADEFAQMISDVGFQEVSYELLTFGACAIHSGFKLN